MQALLGEDALRRLQACRVLVVGLGAVGGACVEALARSGIGHLYLVDGDTFEITNLNRQPFARQSTLGQPKATVTRDALSDLAPHTQAVAEVHHVTEASVEALLARARPTMVVDAIDDLPAKVALLSACVRQALPVWSAMGAARKLNPSALRVTDLSKTEVCPLARILRQRLRALGIQKGIRCVWSNEPALPLLKKDTLGSFMPVTASAGLLLASDLIHSVLKGTHV